jgi:hypothetical protein
MKIPAILSILLLGLATQTAAQQMGVRYMQAAQPLDIFGERIILEAVRDLDPNAKVHFHFDDKSMFQLNINDAVDEAELRSMIAAGGVALRAETPVIERRQPRNTTAEGKPLYIVTGDAQADRARYEQAVQEWNINFPQDRIELPIPAHEDQ